jgi:Kae1-associated kinase Bud32
MRMISEGAEGRVFETSIFGQKAIVKVRQAKAYRIPKLDVELRKSRTKREARAMQRACEAGVRVPMLIGLGEFSIYMEKMPGILLKDKKDGISYEKLGEMLAKMHTAHVIHGDFTPANIMINGSELCVIDFGLSEISESMENKALDLLLMKRSIPNAAYAKFQSAYVKNYANSKQILTRLADIEQRGRYQVRTLT